MLDFIIPLISGFFSTGLFEYWLVPVLALAFIATVPCIIRQAIRLR